jgi:uncharacterized membrane protein YbaN (DUF454 family)
MRRPLYLTAGLASLGLGIAGAFLPVLPTVPFLLLAAFCFARSNPAWERRLLAHPRWGPPIKDWRDRRAISRRAKVAAFVMLGVSAALAWFGMSWPWLLFPLAAIAASGTWIATRAE